MRNPKTFLLVVIVLGCSVTAFGQRKPNCHQDPSSSLDCAMNHLHIEPYPVVEGMWLRREVRGTYPGGTPFILGDYIVIQLDNGSEFGLWFFLEAWRATEISMYESHPNVRVQMQYDPVCRFGISLGLLSLGSPTPTPTPTPVPSPSPSPTATPVPSPTATPTPVPTPRCIKVNPQGKCIKWG